MTEEILPSYEKGVIYGEGARKFASPFRQTGGLALRGLVPFQLNQPIRWNKLERY